MRPFSQLLDALVYTRSRNGKLALIAAYLRSAPDPDRGWALAALTGNLDLKAVKSSAIGEMIRARVDPVLYEMSRDYVGDLAETAALHQLILDRLGPSPVSEDQLVRDLAMPAGDVASELTDLELEGHVSRAPGGLISRTG